MSSDSFSPSVFKPVELFPWNSGLFNDISLDSVSGNQGICGAVVNKSCPASLKPVLNANTTFDTDSGEATPLGAVDHEIILLNISSSSPTTSNSSSSKVEDRDGYRTNKSRVRHKTMYRDEQSLELELDQSLELGV
ncbi:hypothetical protein F2Q68_00012308 [Brassica cretica]|uniref:Uncharacterized protein n=1 Tax=Brassica cretica TaxID=69181 RepID=A0A8S9KYH4_BRACR|nr:hypothetical protein F2Q68_00012308 [Brassica cretica]